MKAVMLSLRPQWCEKIFNGSKTIEVRKTAPKLYDKPRELGEFKNLKGEPIKNAYQSWGYINEQTNRRI